MTSGADGSDPGGRRPRGRFAENAKPLAAVLTGIAALITAVAGMITLLCNDPGGDPAAAATTTVSNVLASPAADGGPVPGTSASTTPSASPTPTPTTSPTPTTPPGSTSSAPAPTTPAGSTSSAPAPTTPPAVPQWEGDVQVNSLGYSLATVPPSPDQSGDPDISAAFDGTFFANLGAAKWTGTTTPSAQGCARLLLAQNEAHVTAVPGDVYCIRVAHSVFNPGDQYAAVRVLAQGRDTSNFPYLRIHATVWPDLGSR